jgi:hypothetical protein
MSLDQGTNLFCDSCGSRLISTRCPNPSCPDKTVTSRQTASIAQRMAPPPLTSATQPAAAPYAADWAAASRGAPNDTYLGNRLLYHDELKTDISGQASAEQLKGLFMQAVIFLALSVVAWIGVSIVSLIVWLFAKSINKTLGRLVLLGGQGVAELAGVAVLIAFWFFPLKEGISEWMIVLDDRAAAADSAYAQIYGALVRRQTPARVRPMRFKAGGGGGRRSLLEIGQGEYSAIVSVFPYGADLFVGWTMWWTIYPGRLLWRVFIHGTRGSKPSFQAAIGSDNVKALREIVHTVTREGVDVAQMGITVDLEATFGSSLPVEQPLG